MALSRWFFSYFSQQTCCCIAFMRVEPISRRGMNHITLAFIAVSFSSGLLLAEDAPHVVSPEVQADGRVTFRLVDPNAAKVRVSIEGQPDSTPMEKDEKGIWSATVGPLQPD